MLGCEPCGEGLSGCVKKARGAGSAVRAPLLRLSVRTVVFPYSHHASARVVLELCKVHVPVGWCGDLLTFVH